MWHPVVPCLTAAALAETARRRSDARSGSRIGQETAARTRTSWHRTA